MTDDTGQSTEPGQLTWLAMRMSRRVWGTTDEQDRAASIRIAGRFFSFPEGAEDRDARAAMQLMPRTVSMAVQHLAEVLTMADLERCLEYGTPISYTSHNIVRVLRVVLSSPEEMAKLTTAQERYKRNEVAFDAELRGGSPIREVTGGEEEVVSYTTLERLLLLLTNPSYVQDNELTKGRNAAREEFENEKQELLDEIDSEPEQTVAQWRHYAAMHEAEMAFVRETEELVGIIHRESARGPLHQRLPGEEGLGRE